VRRPQQLRFPLAPCAVEGNWPRCRLARCWARARSPSGCPLPCSRRTFSAVEGRPRPRETWTTKTGPRARLSGSFSRPAQERKRVSIWVCTKFLLTCFLGCLFSLVLRPDPPAVAVAGASISNDLFSKISVIPLLSASNSSLNFSSSCRMGFERGEQTLLTSLDRAFGGTCPPGCSCPPQFESSRWSPRSPWRTPCGSSRTRPSSRPVLTSCRRRRRTSACPPDCPRDLRMLERSFEHFRSLQNCKMCYIEDGFFLLMVTVLSRKTEEPASFWQGSSFPLTAEV